LAQWLLDREAEGMAFRVTRGRDKITNEAPEGLVLPWSEREVFSIAPVIVGASRGVGRILAGDCVDRGIDLYPWCCDDWCDLVLRPLLPLKPLWQRLAFALALGGIAQLISPMPSMGRLYIRQGSCTA
jgi:predicted phage tail protein